MTDPRVTKLAEVLVDYSLEIREGDLFRIRGEIGGYPLIKEAYRLAVERGAQPFVDIALPELQEIYLKKSPGSVPRFCLTARQIQTGEHHGGFDDYGGREYAGARGNRPRSASADAKGEPPPF